MEILEERYDWHGALTRRPKTDYIVLHHAEAEPCTAQDVHRWHLNNGWCGIGYHFFVSRNGEVRRGRPINATGAHVLNYNSVSVGICFEGDYHYRSRVMPDAQMKAGRELLAYLREKYPGARVVGHRDLMATSCPGQYFPFEEMVNGKEEEMMSREYDELNARLTRVERPMVYNYVDDNMPEWARPTVLKLMRKGALQGGEGGKLELTEGLLRVLVINDRMGLYGE